MTEEEWVACENPTLLLGAREEVVSERKMRLFVCGCCRLIWSKVNDPNAQNAVTIAEQFADNKVSQRQLAEAYAQAARATTPGNKAALITTEQPLTVSVASRSITSAIAAIAFDADDLLAAFATENLRQLARFHDIFGNPFRPVTFAPEWRTDTAVSLARGMYESRDFGAMPILADALQDAGCDNDDVLNHCRGEGPHVRGCWVVDLVLGKE